MVCPEDLPCTFRILGAHMRSIENLGTLFINHRVYKNVQKCKCYNIYNIFTIVTIFCKQNILPCAFCQLSCLVINQFKWFAPGGGIRAGRLTGFDIFAQFLTVFQICNCQIPRVCSIPSYIGQTTEN